MRAELRWLMVAGALACRAFGGEAFSLAGDAAGVAVFDGTPVKCGQPQPSAGFLVRDLAAGTGYRSIVDEALGMKMQVKRVPASGGEIFDVSLRDIAGRDRAVTLVYALPIEGDAVWHENPRQSEPLVGERMSVGDPQCGRGMLSRWPFGAVTVGGQGLALGIDPTAPACYRVAASATARRFYIAFDLGLAKEQACAHFRFCKFGFAAADGFRGALERYQALYPEASRVRATEPGVWMPFHPISKVRGWEDFGFRFKEGDDETAWDDAHGIITFRYTEPCTWWMRMKGDLGKSGYADCVAEAERLAAAGDPAALAWRASATREPDGRYRPIVSDTPWCRGAVWSMNSAPGLAGASDWRFKNGEPGFSQRYAGTFPQGLDGEYVDSAELYMTAALDCDRTHFAGMKTPLCFTKDFKTVGIFKGLVAYEYMRGQAEAVWKKGRWTMANATPTDWCWLAPYADVLGTECNWNPRGKWRPMSDDALMYRRAVCGGKPYCFLQNTDFSRFTYALSEKFMQRSLAYGMLPGYFSADASTGHYFSRPELYDRDRPLFKKYVPLCRKAAAAGWRPVNQLVRSDNPQVITEQFGTEPGARWATVFNLSAKPQRARLRQVGRPIEATAELVGGETWRWVRGEIEVEIPPETVRMLAF